MHASWWDLLQVRFRGSPRPSVYLCVCVSHCTSAWVYSRTVRVKFSRNNCNFSQEETALILLQLHHIVGGRKKIEFIPIVQKNKTAKIIALVFFTLPSSLFLFEISQDTQACSSICCCAYACYLFRISLTLFYNMLTNIFFFFLSPYHCASVFRCVGVLKHPTSNTHSSLHAADLPGSLSVPPVGWNLSRHSRLQWSVSYHEHFFNSTFNLPGLKTPQTTIWHQPQLLHCSGTEERNMISTLNF